MRRILVGDLPIPHFSVHSARSVVNVTPAMLTQCPNPLCKLTFEVPEERDGKNGACPACGQVITFRSLGVIREIERQHQRRRNLQPLSRAGNRGQTGRTVCPLFPAPQFSALLENVRSLWNVGSIFRTADGAGFSRLYLCGITGCPPNKAIAKTSLGAEDHVPWEHHAGALDALPGLIERGVQVVALEQTPQSVPLAEALENRALKAPLCLVVGNEVAGISAETLALAPLHCHLPMRGTKKSLNVAVAFGIAGYLIRERIAKLER